MDKEKQTLDSKSIARLLLKEGREVLINTTGLSMGDSIRNGETIVVRKVPEKQIRFGDIIIFERKNEFVCHRVVRILKNGEGKRFLTKGDSLTFFDGPVKGANIPGKVTRIKRQNGDFIMDSYPGRIVNTIVGLFSLLLGVVCRFFPFKGILNYTDGKQVKGLAPKVLFAFLKLPSKISRLFIR